MFFFHTHKDGLTSYARNHKSQPEAGTSGRSNKLASHSGYIVSRNHKGDSQAGQDGGASFLRRFDDDFE